MGRKIALKLLTGDKFKYFHDLLYIFYFYCFNILRDSTDIVKKKKITLPAYSLSILVRFVTFT